MPDTVISGANLGSGDWQPSGGALIEVRSPYNGELLGSVPDSDAAEVAAVDRRARSSAAPRLGGDADQGAHAPAVPLSRAAAAAPRRAGAQRRARVRQDRRPRRAPACTRASRSSSSRCRCRTSTTGGALEVSRGVRCESRREPLGVVAGITPFNFPAMVPMWMFPIAITVGNAFILKPSEKVPLTALLAGRADGRGGLPAGRVLVVHGGRDDGARRWSITRRSPRSASWARRRRRKRVYARATQHGKRVLCLGGAKNTMIVAPDADAELDGRRGIVDSFTGCAGQRCMAGSLLVAVGDCDALHRRDRRRGARDRARRRHGRDHRRAALATRIEGAIARGRSGGRDVLLDGRRPDAA